VRAHTAIHAPGESGSQSDRRRVTTALSSIAEQTWRERAACGDPAVDRELFFTPDGWTNIPRGDREKAAASICATCPVAGECLEHALTAPEIYGVWGGVGEAARARLRRNRRYRERAS
jgi:WhiB family redox-sensing transcriptional regulator